MPAPTKTHAKLEARAAVDPFVQDLVGLTNRRAHIEIQKRWPEIWAAAEPLGATKSEAWKTTWMQFKAVRRTARAARIQVD